MSGLNNFCFADVKILDYDLWLILKSSGVIDDFIIESSIISNKWIEESRRSSIDRIPGGLDVPITRDRTGSVHILN